LRNDVARAPAKASVAFSAERIDDACVLLVVVTAKATDADVCSKCLPAVAALLTELMVTAEADTASVDAIFVASVAFCAAPKLALETPASVTLDVNVVCVELAKPGGFTVQATAPAAGEYEPGEHGWHSWLDELRKVPAAHGVHDVRAGTLYEPGVHSEQDVEPVVDV
jgi:hypothetical protein